MKHYVIMGGGVAAIGCVEGIRSVDKQGKITIIATENHTTYCRPLISYYLQDKTTEEGMIKTPNLTLYNSETRRKSLESVI